MERFAKCWASASVGELVFFVTQEEENNAEEDLQWWFASARVDVSGGSPVVVHKVRNTINSEPHLPAFWKGLLIEQS